MVRTCFTLAFHAYALGALVYVAMLAQPWKQLGWVARGLTFSGWVLHGVGLVLIPSLGVGATGPEAAAGVRQPLLPFHVAVALAGLAVFAVATAVAAVYLLAERTVKGKRFGPVFRKVPSLELLDHLNGRLVVWGLIALTLTLITGAWVQVHVRPDQPWSPAEVAVGVAWAVFFVLLGARFLAGWRGRKMALLTMAGFGVLVASFVTRYGPWGMR